MRYTVDPEESFSEGKKALERGDLDEALRSFERAYREKGADPRYMSYYGMCVALRRGEIGLGIELCTRAIKKEYTRAEFYLNLGKVFLSVDNKKGAITVFKKGLRFEPDHRELNDLLVQLGVRKPSVLIFLKKSNPINRFLNTLFRRIIPDIIGKRRIRSGEGEIHVSTRLYR